MSRQSSSSGNKQGSEGLSNIVYYGALLGAGVVVVAFLLMLVEYYRPAPEMVIDLTPVAPSFKSFTGVSTLEGSGGTENCIGDMKIGSIHYLRVDSEEFVVPIVGGNVNGYIEWLGESYTLKLEYLQESPRPPLTLYESTIVAKDTPEIPTVEFYMDGEYTFEMKVFKRDGCLYIGQTYLSREKIRP